MGTLPNNEILKVIEQTKVSPPPGSVPTTSLPLTFFDVPWLLFSNLQRPYFFEFPNSTQHFLETLLPTLKHSLSLTLQHFFPFAANLVSPPPPEKPYMLFTDGVSSVSFTVVESSADFDFLSSYQPRPVLALDALVPELAPTRVEEGDTRVGPIMALQVTVFPNAGICLGIRCLHVIADGKTLHHFMKSWALLCRTGGDQARLERELRLPSFDRTVVKDPYGLETEFLKSWWDLESTWNKQGGTKPVVNPRAINFRASFVLRRAQIEKLKSWLTDQLVQDHDNDSSKPFFISSFVATCSLIWTCLAKSEENGQRNSDEEDNNEPYNFAFVADCRSRLDFSLPTTYFGNCLTVCFAPVIKKELLGENGIAAAAKAIKKEIGDLETRPLKEVENWLMKFKQIKGRWQHVTVVGSPKFGVYEADFGWGRPKKSESIHFADSTAFSLVESKEERGGVEVGMALTRERMSRFGTILEETLKELA